MNELDRKIADLQQAVDFACAAWNEANEALMVAETVKGKANRALFAALAERRASCASGSPA